MYETYNSTGYDLYQPFPELDQWVISNKSGLAYHGTFKEVVKLMVEKFDFYVKDIEMGVEILLDSIALDDTTNMLHFGINKTAIFTANYEEHYGRKQAS